MLYENIIKVCDKKNLSLRQVEIKAGLSNGSIGKWKVSSPKVDNLKAVADVLHVSITTLLKDE